MLAAAACSATPDEDPADDVGSALATANQSAAKVLAELPNTSWDARLRIGVDAADAVWYANRGELRIAGGSRFVEASSRDYGGIYGPWFGAGEGFVVHHSVASLLGAADPTDQLSTIGASARFILSAKVLDPALAVDERGSVVVVQGAVSEQGVFEKAFVAVDRSGQANRLGVFRTDALPRTKDGKQSFCEARKIVATTSRFTALFSCDADRFTAVSSVPRGGGEPQLVVPSSPQTLVTDIAAGSGDALYIAERSSDNARSAVYALADGKRTELGAAPGGTVAYRGGKLYVGDATGKVTVREPGKTRPLADLGAPIVQLEPMSNGVAALTRQRGNSGTATVVAIENR